MKTILGIDPSLTSTGIVTLQGGVVDLTQTTKDMPKLETIERVRLIREQVNKVIQHPSIALDLIVIEGFSFGSKGRSLFEIAYLGYRIREDLEHFKNNEGIPWIEVSPDSVKKFTSNMGTSTKSVMIKEVYKRWGFDTNSDDLADAYALAQIGRAYLGENNDLTAFQREVIANLKGDKPAKKTRKKVK